ncbi:hypothetical protein GTA51_20145 [Desulfovibrio aerotolerans]|uniref:HAD family hydrolase n=1 Tax=Solidesulfovibrio aerotolerans TaxID=295255 RepID=A0A7C9IQG0_9BACT|nr:HAD family hydrolase [Solidesulfovibrio aerotolerans]MYL85399.1 hypothetical protein [Solidesulfovibrio aerotolerans]
MLFLFYPDVDWLIGRPTVANAEGNICYRQRDLAWSRSKILSAKGALDEEFMGQDAVFWRRSLWARAGARLDHRFGLAADYELWVRFARHAALHTVRDELSSFRYHGDQRSLAAKAGYHREMAAVIEAELSRLRRMPATTPLDQAPPFLSLDYAAVFPPAATGTLSPRHGESPGASVGPAGLEALEAELRLLQRTLANPLSLRVDFQKDDAGLHQLSGGLPASVRYVFFDCFDTLLYRLSDEPTRLFVEVGRRLLRAGLLAAHVSPGEFRILRQVAETRAREDAWSVRRTRECSIEEIYARLAPVVGDPGRAVEAEIETERDFCYLNPNIASLIATLHRSGKRVAVLSDNYLSSAQLASVLRACGLDLGLFDLILTSRDVGVTKTEGRLFQAALKKGSAHETEKIVR